MTGSGRRDEKCGRRDENPGRCEGKCVGCYGEKWNSQWRGEFKQSSAKAGKQDGCQSKQGVDVVSRCAACKNHLRHQNHLLSANKTKQKKRVKRLANQQEGFDNGECDKDQRRNEKI